MSRQYPGDNGMKSWLDDLDSKLLKIRNQYGHAYYQGFRTGELNTCILSEIAERQSSLLQTPGILEKAAQIIIGSESTPSGNPIASRKASLLIELLKRGEVENSPELVELRSRIQKAEIAFVPVFGSGRGYSDRRKTLSGCEDRKTRREAHLSMQPLLGIIGSACHDFVELANNLSQQSGYPGYFDLCLSQDELNSTRLQSDMDNALIATEEAYGAFLDFCRQKTGSDEPELFDLPLAQAHLFRDADRLFSDRDSVSDLKGTLKSLSMDLDDMPISVEVADSPNAGTCFVLGPDDVRLVLGSETGHFGHYVAFHEFGHALHYCRQPESALLRDTGICLETMADFFAGLLTDPDWLSGFCSMTDREMGDYLRVKKLVDSYRIRAMIVDTRFEYEVFSNPTESFERTWSRLNSDILGVACGDAIWSPFSIYRPAYTKNYVYSHFLSGMLTRLSRESRVCAESSKAMLSLFEETVEQGNVVSFEERMKSAGLDSIELKADTIL